MALINCPECGKEISDEVKTCPSCGKPLKKQMKVDIKKIILPFIFCIFIVLIICCINSPSRIVKKYVKAYNNKDYDKMESLEYDFGYTIKRNIDPEGQPIKVKLLGKGSENELIDNHTKGLYSIDVDNSKISRVYIYKVIDGNTQTQLYKLSIIVVGKVSNKWKIVSSPYYLLQE